MTEFARMRLTMRREPSKRFCEMFPFRKETDMNGGKDQPDAEVAQGAVRDIIMTPQMIEAGAQRLTEVGEASAVYLAEEVFEAMIKIALHLEIYQFAKD